MRNIAILESEFATEGMSKSSSKPASSLDVYTDGPETVHTPEVVVPQVALKPVCASPRVLSSLTQQTEVVAATENAASI